MGMHLQIHVSRSTTLEEAQKWCDERASNESSMVGGEETLEHGLKCAVFAFQFMVWTAHIIDDDFIKRIQELSDAGNCRSDHVIDWLKQRIGCVVWGDNDGV